VSLVVVPKKNYNPFSNISELTNLTQVQIEEASAWLGALLEANDRLVEALMTFEHLDRSVDADSDSDDELAHQQHLYKSEQASSMHI
jgi:hypothetical protein